MTSTTHSRIRILEALGLAACSVVTAGTAVVLGWLEVSLSLVVGTADGGDYAIATGVYGAGAALLLLTPVIAALLRMRLLAVWPGLVLASVLGYLAVTSAGHIASAPPSDNGAVSWVDGARIMVELPWNWPLPVLLVIALVARLGSALAAAESRDEAASTLGNPAH